ncbi:MAG: hypothetical protein ACXAD7_14445 [Candidatus Kariarchaeaceae archaeon]
MPKPVRIAIDLTKGQESIVVSEFKDLQGLIVQSGITVSLLFDEPLSLRKIEYFDILILITPIGEKYKPYEIKSLLQFNEGGGGILVMSRAGGDATLGTNLSSLLKHFDLKLGDGKVLNLNPNSVDPNSISGVSSLLFPGLPDGGDVIFYNAVPIIAATDKIMFSSADESNGIVHPLAAFARRGSGRLVIFGSTSLFDDSAIGLHHEKNSQIFLKVVHWLSHTEDEVYEEEKYEDELLDEEDTSLDNLIKNLVPEISEIVDKENIFQDFEDTDFHVESTVIRILRSFLANALRDAHEGKEVNSIQIEGFDQAIMFLNRINHNLEQLVDLYKKTK